MRKASTSTPSRLFFSSFLPVACRIAVDFGSHAEKINLYR
jgi:hypothetical protein